MLDIQHIVVCNLMEHIKGVKFRNYWNFTPFLLENVYVYCYNSSICSLDAIYNGYVIGVYDKKTGGIVFNPKEIKFPFDPITKKIVKE